MKRKRTSDPSGLEDLRLVRGSEKGKLLGLWFSVALGSVVAVLLDWHTRMPLLMPSGYPNPFVCIFGTVLFIMLAKAAFETIRLKRFGDPALELNAASVPLGGTLEGRITLLLLTGKAPDFTVTLDCIHRVVTNNGKSDHVSEKTIWSADKKATLLPGGILPISMPVPVDQPMTGGGGSSDSYLWRLTVKAPFPFVSFLEQYEILVRGSIRPSASRDDSSGEAESSGWKFGRTQDAPRKEPVGMAVILVLVAIALFVGAGFLFARGVGDIRKVMASESWPVTTGTIIASDAGYSGKRSGNSTFNYYPQITYAYEVNGTAYTGDQIHPRLFWSHGSTLREVAEYPLRSQQPVHYSPVNPGDAVLQARLSPGVFQRLLVATTLMALAGVIAMGGCFQVDLLRYSFPVGKISNVCLFLLFGQGIYLFFAS